MKIYFASTIPLLLISCGSYNHIVERTYLTPTDSPGWVIDDGRKYAIGYHAKFNCGTAKVVFKKIKVYERNVTDSILWLPIIPSSDENTIGKRQLVTDIEYSIKQAPCTNNDVQLKINGKLHKPVFSSDATLNEDETTCRYNWPLKYGSVNNISLIFNEYNACKVPELSIIKSVESTYENHFQAW